MKHVFWLRHGRIAGRCGPNMEPWTPTELASAGIGAVLSVNNAASVYIDELIAAGIDHSCLALADNAPPLAGDFERCLEILPRASSFMQNAIDQNKPVLVHCTAGKDRTGLVMCHYLCRYENLSPKAALEEVLRVRPVALSAIGYEEFGLRVLNELHQN